MRPLFIIALALALVACQQDKPPVEGREAAGAAPKQAADPTDASTSVPTADAAAPVGIPESGIPIALQGSWGMVPADCTSTRGDAKGLLRISAITLTFYESVGHLGTIKQRSDSSLRADYAFTGEGMEWTRDVSLSLSGNTLTRLDRGGDEPGGPFTYTKCQS